MSADDRTIDRKANALAASWASSPTAVAAAVKQAMEIDARFPGDVARTMIEHPDDMAAMMIGRRVMQRARDRLADIALATVEGRGDE